MNMMQSRGICYVDVFHIWYLVAQNYVVVRTEDTDKIFIIIFIYHFDRYGETCCKYKCFNLNRNSGAQKLKIWGGVRGVKYEFDRRCDFDEAVEGVDKL